jgi:hypothetical protein
MGRFRLNKVRFYPREVSRQVPELNMATQKQLVDKKREASPGVLGHITHKGANISLLATEAASTSNYRGFINLFLLIFLVQNTRLVLENLNKYGFMFNMPMTLATDQTSFHLLVILAV